MIPFLLRGHQRLELEDRLVSLDALHTQDETARALVLEHGADYLLTVKGNQPTVREHIETLIAAPQGDLGLIIGEKPCPRKTGARPPEAARIRFDPEEPVPGKSPKSVLR